MLNRDLNTDVMKLTIACLNTCMAKKLNAFMFCEIIAISLIVQNTFVYS